MRHDKPDNDQAIPATIPRINVPEHVPPTPRELDRRRELIAEIDRIRASIGPIGVNVVEMIDRDYYDEADDAGR